MLLEKHLITRALARATLHYFMTYVVETRGKTTTFEKREYNWCNPGKGTPNYRAEQNIHFLCLCV
jgi:hypothetical protein